jgi:hypothetical protein
LQPQDLNLGGYIIELDALPTGTNLFYQPEQDFSDLDNQSAHGVWMLEIQDDRVGATNPPPELVSWQLQFTYANTNLVPFTNPPILNPGLPYTNIVAGADAGPDAINWYTVNVPANAAAAINLLLSASGPVNFLYSPNDPPTTGGSGDAVLLANVTNGVSILTPGGSPALLPGGIYYLGVQDTNGPNATNAIEVNFTVSLQPAPVGGGQAQTNTLSGGDMDYYSILVPTNANFATNILLFATGPVNVWFNPTNLPIANSPPDYGLLYSSTGGAVTLATNTQPPLVPGQTYYLAVQNTNEFSVNYALEVYFDSMFFGTTPPVFVQTPGTKVLFEETQLTVTNTAKDIDPNTTLGYTVTMVVDTNTMAAYGWPTMYATTVPSPVISPTGVIAWTPSEAQGPGVYDITTVVTNSESSPLSAANVFVVIVEETNTPPVFLYPTNGTVLIVDAGVPLTASCVATDVDLPPNPLTFAKVGSGPTGLAVTTDGLITWTPTLSQVGTNTVQISVTDTNIYTPIAANRSYSVTNTFSIIVLPGRVPPVLPALPNTNVNEQTLLTVVNTATDPDSPPLTLSYTVTVAVDTNAMNANGWPLTYVSTEPAPVVSANGIITWTPSEAQGPGVYDITNVATDNGVPPLSATNSFQVTVNEVNTAPGFVATPPSQSVNALSTFALTNSARDSDLPPNPLTYTLLNPPAGMSINPTNGVIVWMPALAQTNNTYTVTTVVTDTNMYALANQSLSATNRFNLTVIAPYALGTSQVQPSQPDTNSLIPGGLTWYQVNVPTNADEATNVLLYATPQAVDVWYSTNVPPSTSNSGDMDLLPNTTVGQAIINTASSVPLLVPGATYWLGVQNVGSVEVSYGVEVNFHVVPPPPPTNTLSITYTNLGGKNGFLLAWYAPTNDLFQVQWTASLAPPVAWSLFSNIVAYATYIAPSNSLFQFFDDGSQSGGLGPVRFYRLQLLGLATNTPPVFVGTPANQIISALSTLTVTNNATDAQSPPQTLTYTQPGAPSGMTISSGGVITWTPTEAQAGTSYGITTVVTDNGLPPMSATNSFQVTVVSVVGPVAFSAPATGVTGTNAQLNGFATPNGFASVAWFQWGANPFFTNQTAPVSVGSGSGVVWVTNGIGSLLDSHGYYFRLVVSNVVGVAYGAVREFSDGSVTVWGDDSAGQANIPAGLSNAVAIGSGEYHGVALKTDSTVTAWGDDTYGQTNLPAGLSNVVAVAGGVYCNLALENNGAVIAWGDDFFGETNVPAGLSNVVAVAAGYDHCLALKSDGTVTVWGDNTYGQTNLPAGLANVVAVAAGWSHSLALMNNGRVIAWGYGVDGETNVPAGLSNAVAVAGGYAHSVALKNDGTVVVWGDDSYGQANIPAGLHGVQAIASGDNHILALKNDGTVVAWGYDGDGETSVPAGLSNVVAVAGGGGDSLALQAAVTTPLIIPAIQSVSVSARSITLEWTAPTYEMFQVEWAPALPAASWTAVPGTITSASGVFQFVDDGSQTAPLGTQRFYRLVVQ